MANLRNSSLTIALLSFLLVICTWSVQDNPFMDNPKKKGIFIREMPVDYNATAIKPAAAFDNLTGQIHFDTLLTRFYFDRCILCENANLSAFSLRQLSTLPVFITFRVLRI